MSVLTYSVEPLDEDFSAERPILAGLAAVLGATVAGWAAGYLALNVVGSQRFVAILAGLIVPVAGLGTALSLTHRGSARRRRNAVLAVGGVAVAGFVLNYQVVTSMRPTFPQLRAALTAGQLPPGYELAAETTEGDRLCRERCPTIERVYRTPAVDDPIEEMVLSMFRHGWAPADRNIPAAANTATIKGDIVADLVHVEDREVRVLLSRRL